MGSQSPYNDRFPQGAPRARTPYEARYGAPSTGPQSPGGRPQQPGPGPQQPGPSRPQPGASAAGGTPTTPGAGHPMTEEDFEQLCRQIGETVEQVSRAVGKGLGHAGTALGDAISRAAEKQRQAAAERAAQASAPQPSGAPGAPAQAGGARPQAPGAAGSQPHAGAASIGTALAGLHGTLSARAAERQRAALMRTRFKPTGGLTATGVVMTAFGGIGVAYFTLFAVAAIALPALAADAMSRSVGLGVFAVLDALAAVLLVAGIRRLRLAGAARVIQRAFGTRQVRTFAELAAQSQRPEKRIRSGVRRMLRAGLLPQGHIDDEDTCLMVTDDAYRQYRTAQAAWRERELAEARERRAAEEAQAQAGALPPEARAVIEEGEAALARLRELDAVIDDAAVSAKIAAIEDVVARILDRVRDEPATTASLDRLTSYYLPTTVRLLEAYDDLEEQPVQGEHITGSRRQIERTLDTLCAAYEKLLDETFRDVAMDVSADISVLHTVLAQEGLTDNPFDQTTRGSGPATRA